MYSTDCRRNCYENHDVLNRLLRNEEVFSLYSTWAQLGKGICEAVAGGMDGTVVQMLSSLQQQANPEAQRRTGASVTAPPACLPWRRSSSAAAQRHGAHCWKQTGSSVRTCPARTLWASAMPYFSLSGPAAMQLPHSRCLPTPGGSTPRN